MIIVFPATRVKHELRKASFRVMAGLINLVVVGILRLQPVFAAQLGDQRIVAQVGRDEQRIVDQGD